MGLAIDGTDDIATRNIHLPVEYQRYRITGNGCISNQIEGDDLLDVGHGARWQDDDGIARLYRTAGNGALVATEAFTRARHALNRHAETNCLRRAHGCQFQCFDQRRAVIPRHGGMAA
ncbi:hypothetical protein D3C80_1758210 [compost metagenome]